MKWNRNEINRLLPILEQLSFDLAPVDRKKYPRSMQCHG